MGRTIVPYSIQINRIKQRFQAFRKTLRREDQEIFDELMRHPKMHVQAGVMAAFPNPNDPVIMSILLEQQKQIKQLQYQLNLLQNKIKEDP